MTGLNDNDSEYVASDFLEKPVNVKTRCSVSTSFEASVVSRLKNGIKGSRTRCLISYCSLRITGSCLRIECCSEKIYEQIRTRSVSLGKDIKKVFSWIEDMSFVINDKTWMVNIERELRREKEKNESSYWRKLYRERNSKKVTSIDISQIDDNRPIAVFGSNDIEMIYNTTSWEQMFVDTSPTSTEGCNNINRSIRELIELYRTNFNANGISWSELRARIEWQGKSRGALWILFPALLHHHLVVVLQAKRVIS